MIRRAVPLLAAVALCLVGTAPAQAAAVSEADFNGDGIADLAIGVPGEDLGTIVDAGAVNVLYGSATGLTGTGNQLWTQDSTSVLDAAETNDHFGAVLAVGDFNGDSFGDLAIGVPDEDVGSVFDAGAVNVLYGSSSGLTASGNQFWTQNSTNILDSSEVQDHFGAALATTNTGLAIGVPDEDVGTVVDAGAVNVLYAALFGPLAATNNQFWTQDSTSIADAAEANDHFGAALSFGTSGAAYLAVGVPDEDLGGVADAGAVNVLYSPQGLLSATGNQFWTQNSTNILDVAEHNDHFGAALAADTGPAGLAVGVPDEDVGTVTDAGALNLIPASNGTLTATGNQLWTQDSTDILDTAEVNDHFGAALATGRFANLGDLAVGVPDEDVGTVIDAGAVNVIHAAFPGLSATGNQFWSQDSPNVADVAEANDHLGAALTAGGLKGATSVEALVLGIPDEDVGGVTDAGAINVLYGSASDLTTTGNRFLNQNSVLNTIAILDTAEANDHFGAAVTSADVTQVE